MTDGGRVVAVSVTEGGRRLAARLPYEHRRGRAAETVRALWPDVDALVLFLATGAAVRIVAPLLGGKDRDPAVVTVDQAGRFAIALIGGHRAGANALAAEVAALVGATPVVTTATDATGHPALDQLPGMTAHGPVSAVTRALLDGDPVPVRNPLGWPLPDGLAGPGDGSGSAATAPGAAATAGDGAASPAGELVVDDHACPGCPPGAGEPPAAGDDPPVVVLHPPSLVVGVGCSSDASAADVADAVGAALAGAGLSRHSVTAVATIDRRGDHPAVTALGLPVEAFPADALAAVSVPTPSEVVRAAVGTPSVAEAAALLAAGPDAALVAGKQVTPRSTAAVARRARPRGRVTLVGLGPGAAAPRTPAATAAVRHADAVVGYGPYVDQCAELLAARQTVVRSPIGAEVGRARQALDLAAAGRQVALVCSGDAGVFAMASPVLELTAEPRYAAVEVVGVPGVTAAAAAAAVLGAPLGHDHAFISLSDLLTPWPVIEQRVRAAAAADLVVAFYNPRSARRHWQLERARQILLQHRPATTPAGIVTDAGRPGQRVVRTTLADLDPADVTMTSCVVVGSSATTVVAGRMVTRRGYGASAAASTPGSPR